MNHIFVLYIASVLLQVLPLYHIVRTRKLQQYIVFAIASSGFLFLNLIGTISVQVTRYQLIGFHYANLVIAISFAVTYWILLNLKRSFAYLPLQQRFQTAKVDTHSFRNLFLLLLAFHFASLLVFSAMGAQPLVFRFDLFGDWPALVQERIHIVQHPAFYWFSLGIFETPLFLTLLCTVLWLMERNSLLPAKTSSLPWKRYAIVVIVYSLLLSIIYLNKQYLIYLLAALVLTHIVMSNRLSPVRLSFFSAVSLLSLFILYKIYAGSVTLWSIAQIIAHRIFEVYAWAGAVAFHLYPQQMPFLHGTSIVNPRGIFPYRQVIVADLIYPYIYGDIGYGNAPLPAIYENYVNFGWWGIASGIVIVSTAIIALTLLSWTKDLFLFVVSLFLTIKTLLLWQAPFWFGFIEPTLATMIVFLLVLKIIVFRYWPSRSQRSKGST